MLKKLNLQKIKNNIKRKRKLIIALFVIICFVLVVHFLFKVGLSELENAIRQQGIKGELVYIIYLIISVPIVTLPNFPLWPLVYLTYGYFPSVIMTTIGVVTLTMAGYVIKKNQKKS